MVVDFKGANRSWIEMLTNTREALVAAFIDDTLLLLVSVDSSIANTDEYNV